ncbi:lytic transglycosylase domain-containing protein [Lichenicola cladoniae]|uniref:lytic transglycosylase domain-containing protein n=1 Tax=Lichenicola cladoniae TaxID=1484109 RepID=UPI001EF53462|nr:lytic transglycosylase domain-containing protein [Lichenicola cladoniae]
MPSRTSILALASTFLLPVAAHAASLPLQAFSQLATSCAPHVAVETLAAVARTESGFDALTLHDNSTGRSYHPTSRDDAIALGVELATVDRHSVDFGLMQINGANLPRLGLSISNAFNPCRNLAAADRLLVQSYTAPIAGQDTQPAIQHALSRYNTGDPARGLANGYVSRVQKSAELVVPALRVQGDTAPNQPATVSTDAPVLAQPLPPPPPNWDVYARAKTGHGQVLGASSVPVNPVSVAAAPPAPAGPMAAQHPNIEAMNNVR